MVRLGTGAIALALIVLSGCAAGGGRPERVTRMPLFAEGATVAFEQNGHLMAIEGGVVHLDREPFALVFEFPVGDGIMLHASVNPDHSDRLTAGKPLHGMFPVSGACTAEWEGNPDRDLVLFDEAYHYWHADPDGRPRFDEVAEAGPDGHITCVRSVEQLSLKAARRRVPVSDYPYDAVYLVFVSPHRYVSGDDGAREYRLLTLRFPATRHSKQPPGVPEWRGREEGWYLEPERRPKAR